MSLENTLGVLNEMQRDGVLGEYAIGGAVAAFLYIEPAATFDLDVFTAWKPGEGGLLDVSGLYGYLIRRGYKNFEREAIVIEDWAVQFLPLGSPLIEEALAEAAPIQIKGVPTRIFSKEHLMAVCLEVGRPKDLARLVQFLDESDPDMSRFGRIVEKHRLDEAWNAFKMRYLAAE
jgi:hypothetical protein